MNTAMSGGHEQVQWHRVSLLGVKIDALSLDELLTQIRSTMPSTEQVMISYVNTYAVNLSYTLPWFREFLNQSYLTFCDGFGIKLAAKLTGQQLSYRFTPQDFIDYVCEDAVRNNWRIFFLGAKPGVAQLAAKTLIDKHPGLKIETYHGYFCKAFDSVENLEVIERINVFQPHILAVGFGMPLQEQWILENLNSLNAKIAFPVGALFDYISGQVLRGPRWMTDHGLEWLSRLAMEPRRLWKRYIIGNPLFIWRVFAHHFLGFPLPE